MDASSSDFDERFQAFRTNIEEHAENEENEVLPLLDKHRASHELRLMDTGFVIAETIAPTHAHRLAPESATATFSWAP